MECSKAWECMMNELDGNCTEKDQRDLMLHLSSCKSCAALYRTLNQTAELLDGDESLGECGEDLLIGLEERVMSALPDFRKNPLKVIVSPWLITGLLFLLAAMTSLLFLFLTNSVVGTGQSVLAFLGHIAGMIRGVCRLIGDIASNAELRSLVIATVVVLVSTLFTTAILVSKKSVGNRFDQEHQ